MEATVVVEVTDECASESRPGILRRQLSIAEAGLVKHHATSARSMCLISIREE
jgi:hypothetical protein